MTSASPKPALPDAAGPEFSLVRGGLVFDLWCRLGLADARMGQLHRRVGLVVLVAWLPLLLLSFAEGSFRGGIALPFVDDIETHVRLLIALPLLLVAEVVAHRRMLAAAAQFLERGLIPDDGRARFDAALASVARLRDSRAAEVALLVIVYGVGVLFVWRTQVALNVQSWYGVWAEGKLQPSAAGWWLGLVGLPMFQFFLLRWYYRLLIWVRFLWQVSRLDLHLVATHPDRCGGLGFLGFVSLAFSALVMAQSAVLAGIFANRIFFAGSDLLQFRFEAIGWSALMVLIVLGPLVVFMPRLEEAARRGRREYGLLAQLYVNEFERKWIRGGAPAGEQLIGSADVQSLADMGGSLDVVSSMRWVPCPPRAVMEVLFVTLIPFLPLTLTKFSAQEVTERLLKLLF